VSMMRKAESGIQLSPMPNAAADIVPGSGDGAAAPPVPTKS
jgi:hypothetical protein